MNYDQMMSKTKIEVSGMVKNLVQFVSSKTQKVYWSVLVDVVGSDHPVTLKLPENFDNSSLVMYQVFTFSCSQQQAFDKKYYELKVLSIVKDEPKKI